jgi:hypothetical protein
LTFDDAILATGLATVRWLRQEGGQPEASGEVASHVAIALRDTDGSLNFIQALPTVGVIKTSEADFFHGVNPASTSFYLATVRPSDELRQRRALAASLASRQVGKPYAANFEAPPNAFYCSSLVTWAYSQAAAQPPALSAGGQLCPSNFTLLFTPQRYWDDYYASLVPPQQPPANITGSNPTLVLQSPRCAFLPHYWPGYGSRQRQGQGQERNESLRI